MALNPKESLAVLVFLCCVLLVPFICYGIYRLYPLRTAIVIKKRNPRVVIIFNILCCTLLLSTYGFLLFVSSDFQGFSTQQRQSLGLVLLVIYPIQSHAIFCMQLYRFYMVFFEINFFESTLNSHWKCIIDPITFKNQEESNFFLRHRLTLGSKHIMRNVFGAIWVITASIPTTLYAIGYDTKHRASFTAATMVDFFIYLVYVATSIIFIFNTPLYYDYFKVASELKLYGYVYGALVIVLIGSAIVRVVAHNDTTEFAAVFLQIICGILFCFATNYISTHWVFREVLRDRVLSKILRLQMDLNLTNAIASDSTHVRSPTNVALKRNVSMQEIGASSTTSVTGKCADDSNASKKTKAGDRTDAAVVATAVRFSVHDKLIPMEEVLSHSGAFEVFMNHLSREFSMENLLAFLEFKQYKQCLEGDSFFMYSVNPRLSSDTDTPGGPMDTVTSAIDGGIVLPPTLPKSAIVWAEMDSSFDLNFSTEERRRGVSQSRTITSTLGIKGITEALVDDLTPKQSYKRVAYLLYRKYIKSGSDYEINISYRTRIAVVNLMTQNGSNITRRWIMCDDKNDVSNADLYTIFDGCIKEMRSLMRDSYSRFISTQQYHKISELLSDV